MKLKLVLKQFFSSALAFTVTFEKEERYDDQRDLAWFSQNSFVPKRKLKGNLVANRINSGKEKFEFGKCLKFKMDSSYCSAE